MILYMISMFIHAYMSIYDNDLIYYFAWATSKTQAVVYN